MIKVDEKIRILNVSEGATKGPISHIAGGNRSWENPLKHLVIYIKSL